MAQQHRSFPFRWVLPSVQLVVCFLLLWPARGVLILGVMESIDAYSHSTPRKSAIPDPRGADVRVPPVSFEKQRTNEAATRVAEIRTKAPLALNFPVLVVQIPYVVLNPTKQERVPRGMSFDTWRALSWPFAGILFWWFLGRSVEAFLAARRSVVHRRISWIETGFALILLVIGLVAFIGLLTTTPDDGNDLQFMTLLAGWLLWGVLATVTIAAHFLQWRAVKRRLAAHATADPSLG